MEGSHKDRIMSEKHKIDFEIINRINNSHTRDFEIKVDVLSEANSDDYEITVDDAEETLLHVSSNEEHVNLYQEIDLGEEFIKDEFLNEEKILVSKEIHDLNCRFDKNENRIDLKEVNVVTNDKLKDCSIEYDVTVIDDENEMNDENLVKDNLCSFCLLTFNSKKEIEEHVKAIHGNYKFDYMRRARMNSLEECLNNKEIEENCNRDLEETMVEKNEEENMIELLKVQSKEPFKELVIFIECAKCLNLFPTNNEDGKVCQKCLEEQSAINEDLNLVKETRYLRSENVLKEFCITEKNIDDVCKVKSFKTESPYRRRMQQTHNSFSDRYPTQKQLHCPKCSRTYLKRYFLNLHIEWCFNNEICCRNCNTTFPNITSLRSHHSLMHKNAKKTSKCPECLNMFVSRTEVTKHMCDVHRDIVTEYCGNCGKRYTKKYLRKHLKKCLGNKSYPKNECAVPVLN